VSSMSHVLREGSWSRGDSFHWISWERQKSVRDWSMAFSLPSAPSGGGREWREPPFHVQERSRFRQPNGAISPKRGLVPFSPDPTGTLEEGLFDFLESHSFHERRSSFLLLGMVPVIMQATAGKVQGLFGIESFGENVSYPGACPGMGRRR